MNSDQKALVAEFRKSKLSQNFTAWEMVRSDRAIASGIIHSQLCASPAILANLRRLCVSVLQPVRDHWGPIIVTSGYRSTALNSLVGGATNSYHTMGLAADFVIQSQMHGRSGGIARILDWLMDNRSIKFDTVINEYNRWVHIQINGVLHEEGRRIFLMKFPECGLRGYDSRLLCPKTGEYVGDGK